MFFAIDPIGFWRVLKDSFRTDFYPGMPMTEATCDLQTSYTLHQLWYNVLLERVSWYSTSLNSRPPPLAFAIHLYYKTWQKPRGGVWKKALVLLYRVLSISLVHERISYTSTYLGTRRVMASPN